MKVLNLDGVAPVVGPEVALGDVDDNGNGVGDNNGFFSHDVGLVVVAIEG
eukprot:CAMPEP_0203681722 /NCGR_PEP_ID=MMETSP0090-20130426/43543_1 /ASSEMBLY_ACC=CAM_ASM_001088 /TAXON_ID=426623 /ORGANISM="Chaetoceros affinis, Strain CCMP159" /LENGTH=49 /DNA_ID=CAMNT_0050550317 /DNA_START=27 /DNA_END=176 /DNA_ORIENTATION=+